MDWQKNLLLAAIAAVFIMLFIRWNQFQEQLPSPQEASIASSSAAVSSGAAEIPSAIPNASSDGLPASAEAPSQALIEVKTDSLLINISPLGGDIVSVALPRHYAKQDTPDEPFVLLDNRNNHTYVSQSGLIGTNGTDTAQGRPVFSSAAQHYQLKDGENQLVVDLTLKQGEANITKRFTFTRGAYLVGVEYIIDNQADTPWSAQLYGQIKRDNQNFVKVSALEMNPFLGAAITTTDENYKKSASTISPSKVLKPAVKAVG